MPRPRELERISQRSKTDIVDVGGGFGADLDAAILGLDHAIVDADVGAGAEVAVLPGGLDHDGVVAADDVAVADLDVAAMVGVDAIAVGHVQKVADLHAVHQDVLAADHVQTPVGRLAEADIVDLQVLAAASARTFWGGRA